MKLEICNISKSYGSKKAVNSLNLSMQAGVYGLLGANGAGKTTLMRMICTLLEPTKGKILFNGKSIKSINEDYCSRLGYMPQNFGFYKDFTAKEFMHYMAAVKGIGKLEAKNRTEELLYLVNLESVANKKIKTFSGGMKQRLGIAQAELNSPEILILDEPTAGLDPKERVRFRNLISDFAKNKIVILSTHIVSDVSYIADTLLMMTNGRLLLNKPMVSACNSIDGKVWDLLVSPSEASEIERVNTVVNWHHENGKIALRVVSENRPIIEAESVSPTLEDLFMYHFSDEIMLSKEGK